MRFSILPIILLLLFNSSCNKKEQPNKPLTLSSDAINAAREFFNKEIKNPIEQLNRSGQLQTPIWEEAVTKHFKGGIGEVVIVPFNFAEKGYVKINNNPTEFIIEEISRLLIYTDNEGRKQAEIVTTLPDEGYLNDTTTNKIFTGMIWVTDYQGKQLRNYRYEKNGIIRELPRVEQIKTRPVQLRERLPTGKCWVDYYYCVSAGGHTTCSYNYSKLVDCGGSSGGPPGPVYEGPGGNVGAGAGNYPGVNNPGGGLGITPEMSAKKIELSNIARPCLKTILADVTVKSNMVMIITNAIRGIDNNILTDAIVKLVKEDSWKVIIDEKYIPNTYLPDGSEYQTDASTGFDSQYPGKVVVTFNINYLSKGTDLSIARTMIHELLHAYFVQAASNLLDPGFKRFEAIHKLLYDRKGRLLTGDAEEEAQHETIATKYIEGLSSVLYQYALVAGINSPDPSVSLQEYCNRLAWGGLLGTKAYNYMKFKDQTKVKEAIAGEADNTNKSTRKKNC